MGGAATQDVDYEAVKQVQQRVWSAGDFAMVATGVVIVGEQLCEAADIVPGERVLDVACGSGNATLAAARRSLEEVVGVDFVPELLEHGRARAAVERLEARFVEGDAERLPFEDRSFDVVISTFGAMFTPDQPRTARELLRVCRPGGRIGMANWTPDGLVGQILGTIARYAPPPPGVRPPALWGAEERLRELFGEDISSLQATRTAMNIRFRSAEHFLEFFRTYFGPIRTLWARLDDAGRTAFAAEVVALLERFNRAGERAFVAPAGYLEVVARRR